MGFIVQVVFAAVLWVLGKYERHRSEEREYETGRAHGRAECHAELASWINEHHPDILKDFPRQ